MGQSSAVSCGGQTSGQPFSSRGVLLGQAGLLEEDFQEDSYHQKLRKEFHYLQHKFGLPVPMTCDLWSFLRLRPGNFPHVRLAQLAWLYHKEQSLFSRVMAAETPEDVKKILSAQTSTYWEEHFTFKRLRLTGKNGWGRMP